MRREGKERTGWLHATAEKPAPLCAIRYGMIRATIRISTGVGLVILGIIGLILPIMPGWIFLIPGLVILAEYFPPIHRLIEWAKRKVEWERRKAEWKG